MFIIMNFCIMPAAVFLVLGTLAGCSSLQVLNAITPGSTYQKIANLAYGVDAVGVAVTEIYFDKTSHTTLNGAMSWPLRGLAPVLDTVDRFVASDGGRILP